MEYDNDRVIKPTNRLEIFYWILLCIIGPLVNCFSLFVTNYRIWWVLLLIGFLTFPAYLLYSRLIWPMFFYRKRTLFFIAVSALFFLVVHAFLFLVYSFVLKFPLSAGEKFYFTYSGGTFARESVWIVINMSFAVAVFFIRKSIEEKDILQSVQKNNDYFKLRYLWAQLSPHFLFNTLNSIYSLSLQKSDKTPEVVIKLADIMRYLIYECNEEKIPLDKEIEFIRNYIEIEKMRYQADIRLTIEGKTEGIMVEPFLFISFIENGFKHALDNSFTEPFIYINLKAGEGKILLNVINSSNADLGEQAKRMGGKGMTNSRSLLELLYPDAYALDIIQTEKEENRESSLRIRNAKERLESLYPDSHTLDVILNKNTFAVSLMLKSGIA